METKIAANRSLGLFGATGVGVGAIVGGGILALAGVAFATTGPAALVAFALNGLIAVLTALSFAEMSVAFPESGGTYTFSKKVLSVEAAFTVGWVVWFASIVAAVLYALGFAAFAVIVLQMVWQVIGGSVPAWLATRWTTAGLAVGATLLYTLSLTRQSAGGGQWINVTKVAVFGVLILGGLWVLPGRSLAELQRNLTPFFASGALGLVQAMGYTFIALQGFDLIAAVAGEIRDPAKTIPRSMLASLGIALLIYLPLLFVVVTVGVLPGQSIVEVSARQPETIIAVAAETYLGPFGYWLVVAAALLSMLSALQANLFAASRVARAMARDRTLPYLLDRVNPRYGTPVMAVLFTAALVIGLIVLLPDVAAAGAASSLIFLLTFALAHGINILIHRRGGVASMAFRVPWYPLIPTVGVLACLGLAIFQGVSVPAAGLVASIWLILGGGLYLFIFARRATVVDASAEALDPELLRLRGRSPLVLVPIANPANARAMVFVASALAPPRVGRVLLLSVVAASEQAWQQEGDPPELLSAQMVLRESLKASFAANFAPEALTTVASEPWAEIARVAQTHRCQSLLLGLTDLESGATMSNLEQLISNVECDVVVLRVPQIGWRVPAVRRILVPVGGQGDHDQLRARLLASLWRTGEREVTFLQVLPRQATDEALARNRNELYRLGREEVPGEPQVLVVRSDESAKEIVSQAVDHDLVILGLPRLSRRRRVFGPVALEIVRQTGVPIIMISRYG